MMRIIKSKRILPQRCNFDEEEKLDEEEEPKKEETIGGGAT